jgi:hypothetical protein
VKTFARSLYAAAVRGIEARSVVQLHRCYHYRGFRYGGYGNNPYEDYILGLARGEDVACLRQRFADQMLNTRAQFMGEALQIDIRPWPLWEYPWARRPRHPRPVHNHPREMVDIVCDYCEAGVLSSQINREFGWLDGAWRNISAAGYQPKRYTFIRCRELRAREVSSFIVLDGNHRLSALHALGATSVEVQVNPLRKVERSNVANWPRVRDGSLSAPEALRIFDRYFAADNPILRRTPVATLITDELPQWTVDARHHADSRSQGERVSS